MERAVSGAEGRTALCGLLIRKDYFPCQFPERGVRICRANPRRRPRRNTALL